MSTPTARQIIGKIRITIDEVPTPTFAHVTIIDGDNQREGYAPEDAFAIGHIDHAFKTLRYDEGASEPD